MKLYKSLLLTVLITSSYNTFASETLNYTCDGKEMKASFPDEEHAVMYFNGELTLLKSAVSASGARYTGNGWQLWSSKDDITLNKISAEQIAKNEIPSGKGIECHEVDHSITP